MSWQERAACKGRQDLMFGPEYEYRPARRAREARAVLLCETCPVRRQCAGLIGRLGQATEGVWAGMTEEDRKRTVRRRRREHLKNIA